MVLALATAAAGMLALAFAVPAGAHVERASYWPDPGVEIAGGQPAGGAVPAIRSLFTATDASAPGDTRVVCPGGRASVPTAPTLSDPQIAAQIAKLRKKIKKAKAKHQSKKVKRLKRKMKKLKKDPGAADPAYQAALRAHPSIKALQASIADAEANGYKLRPSGALIRLLPGEGAALLDTNLKLLAACAFDSIQDAVNASGNNDRVVILPGLYTEPKSRAQPTNDPACADLKETNDKGSTAALSYRYQFTCPNDQNLIAVIGRAVGSTLPPQPPLEDRHGIPDAGPCIRCNLQMEGSGVGPDDVVVDAGNAASGDGPPADPAKDVGIRADRADGFVLRNIKVRHAREHAIYSEETDGFHLDRFETAYAGEYGMLTFVLDHALVEHCDAYGSGDSGIYPGASADLGDAVPADQRRYGTEIRYCDSHHNSSGYSGTDGNAVWLHNNDFYDNVLGFTTDVFTAPGHPGFPQDSDLIENNDFYSNNFNAYLPPCPAGVSPGPAVPGQSADAPGGNCSDVAPTVPVPVGTGMWIAGGNHNIVRNNRFWNNWRRGTMLFAVPDQLVCGPAGVDPSQLAGCNPAKVPPSTSYNNEYYGNAMGKAPDGSSAPNGVDFWWDSFLGNTGNCWHDNGAVTSEPPGPLLPSDCSTSVGTGNPAAEAELLGCFAAFSQGVGNCDWFTTPPKP
jgi:hypothetical protein